jgi:hypothetical protein
MARTVSTTCWPRTPAAPTEIVNVPFGAVTAPKLLFATTTLAPPRGSPVVCAVTRPLIVASWAASGVGRKQAIATVTPTSSAPNLRTRMNCLCCGEGTRKGRHFAVRDIEPTSLVHARRRDVTALQTSEDQLGPVLAPMSHSTFY